MNELISEKDSVPKGWIKTTTDSVATIILGQSPPSSTYNQEKKGLPFFQGKTDFGLMYPAVRNWCSDPKKSAEKNDILISVRAPVGSTNISKEKCCIGRGLAAIRPLSGVNYLWIFYHLRLLKNNIAMKGTGTTFQAISGTQLKSIILSIPPLNEQKRIVSKIESIFAQIDATKEQLEMLVSKTKFVPGSLNTLRNSVLKQAFEGKLVPQDLNDEPAEILLKRISKDFKELILKNDRLPKGWTKTNVGQLYDIIGGGTPSTKIEKYWKGNIPWISSADIYDLYDIRPRRSITVEAVKSSATNLVPSESIIVVTRVGLGKIAYTKTPICFSQDSQALVGNNSIIDPHYALYYLSKAVQIFKYSNRGTTISGVTKKQLSELSFFLPPLNEQKRIVAKIESIFGNIDSIEKQVNDAIRSLNMLKQSVLKLAFEGKLVPQDPNDEPASVLLEKIKLQKK